MVGALSGLQSFPCDMTLPWHRIASRDYSMGETREKEDKAARRKGRGQIHRHEPLQCLETQWEGVAFIVCILLRGRGTTAARTAETCIGSLDNVIVRGLARWYCTHEGVAERVEYVEERPILC